MIAARGVRSPAPAFPAIFLRPPPHFAAVGGSTPFGLRPLGAGGLPRTRPPSSIHRVPRAPGLRSSAPRSHPSQTPPSRRRRPRLPGARSPTTSPSWRPTAPFPNPPTTRRIRHPLPSFLPKPHLPAADQLQSKLDRLMRSRPPSRPGVTHPPIMSTLGRTPRRGDGRLLFMLVAAPPRNGVRRVGRIRETAIQEALPAPSQQPRSTDAGDSFRHYCRYRSTWLAPSFVRLVLRKRSQARWPTHSPFRLFRASIPSFATPTVPRAGAGTARTGPLRLFGGRGSRPSPRRRRPSRTSRAFSRPPRTAPLRALRPLAVGASPTPTKPPAIRPQIH